MFTCFTWIKEEDVPRWSLQSATWRIDNFEFGAKTTMGFDQAEEYKVGKAALKSLIYLLYS